MKHPIDIQACTACGGIWDTHGVYKSCPRCGASIQSSTPASAEQARQHMATYSDFYREETA